MSQVVVQPKEDTKLFVQVIPFLHTLDFLSHRDLKRGKNQNKLQEVMPFVQNAEH